MHKFEIDGTVKSASATTVHLFLNNIEVDLQRNGDTWTGKKTLDIDDSLAVLFTAKGFNGTAWALEIGVTCPSGAAKLLSKNDTIGASGKAKLEQMVKIPADPCAKNQ